MSPPPSERASSLRTFETLVGSCRRLNNTAHNEPHALTIDRPDRSSSDKSIKRHVDGVLGLKLQRVKFLRLDEDVVPLGVLIALDDFFFGDFLEAAAPSRHPSDI